MGDDQLGQRLAARGRADGQVAVEKAVLHANTAPWRVIWFDMRKRRGVDRFDLVQQGVRQAATLPLAGQLQEVFPPLRIASAIVQPCTGAAADRYGRRP